MAHAKRSAIRSRPARAGTATTRCSAMPPVPEKPQRAAGVPSIATATSRCGRVWREERDELDRDGQRPVVRRGQRQHDHGLAAAAPRAVVVGRPPARAEVGGAGLARGWKPSVLAAPRRRRRPPAWDRRRGGRRPLVSHSACRGSARACGSAHVSFSHSAACLGRSGAPGSTSRRTQLSQLVADPLDARSASAARRRPTPPGAVRARDGLSARRTSGTGSPVTSASTVERLAQLSAQAVPPRLLGHAVPVEALGAPRSSSAASAAQRSGWVSVNSRPWVHACSSASSRQSTRAGDVAQLGGLRRGPERRRRRRGAASCGARASGGRAPRRRRRGSGNAWRSSRCARVGTNQRLEAGARPAPRSPAWRTLRGTAMSRSSIGRRATRQPVWASTAAPLISMTGTPDSVRRADGGRGVLEQHLRPQPREARDPLHLGGDRVVLAVEPLGEQREHALRGAVEVARSACARQRS